MNELNNHDQSGPGDNGAAHQIFRRLTILFGFATVLVSILGFLGIHWNLSIDRFFNPSYKTIAFSAAVIWMVFGMVLAIQAEKPFRGRIQSCVLALLGVIAGFSLIDFLLSLIGQQFIVEAWLYQLGNAILANPTTPMSPLTAGLIFPASVALGLLVYVFRTEKMEQEARNAAGIIGVLIFLFSFTFFLSYVYGIPFLYETQILPISPTSSIAELLLCAGLITAAGPTAVPLKYFAGNSTKAQLLRTFLPLVIILIFFENFLQETLFSVYELNSAVKMVLFLGIVTVVMSYAVLRAATSLGNAIDSAEHRRKEAEVVLRESEKQYRTLLDQVPELILVQRNGIILYVNPAAEKTLKYTREEALNRPVSDFIAPEYLSRVAAAIPHRMNGEEVEPYEIEIVGKDGGRRTVIISGRRTEFEGTPASLNVLTDITERKRVENALKKSEQQYRTLLEQVPELILVHQKGIIKYVNPAALKTLEYTPEDALNKPVSDFIVPEYMGRVAAALRQRPVGETVEPYEIEILGKEGGRRTVIVSGSLIEFEGAPASLNVLTDITDRKALEVAVHQANRKLNLLSSITRHDIINQLTLLIGYIAISRRYLDDKKTLTAFLDKEEKAAATIERQIRFTKEYQDVGVAAPVWQNVSASVTQAVAELPMRSVRVEVDRDDLEIFADPLFEKVFYNLIDNAIRYGGEQMTTVRVSSKESGTCLTILCEDDGAGIAEAEKMQLFTQGFGKNTGLGLFLSKEILSITGITIAETGSPGKGARFEITVPKGAYRFGKKDQI